MRSVCLPLCRPDASLSEMTAWTHTLHLLWVLALLVPRVGLAMPGDTSVPFDCPGHEQAAPSSHSTLANHLETGDPGNQHGSDHGCSVDCVLSCGVAGLQAGLPTGAFHGELLPDAHPVAKLTAREPVARPGSLFRPPRP